ncbi:MAG: LysR family transcriptional regulator [Acidobacteria bacterium]|nr:LysR family transcriptional regulator [Acidobacteriota bacterium]
MQWLNYHHLLYFWIVAREGSIARATKELRLAEPTIRGQIHRLEQVLGEKLFERSGRRLVLTECGRLAYDYAGEIFSMGREFMEVLKGRGGVRPARLRVGVADVLPKAIVRRALEPALHADVPIRLVCHGDNSVEEFIDQLTAHALDLVLADAPAPPGRAKVFNHRLGECGTTIFGAASLARSRRKGFPQSLDAAPFLAAGLRSARRLGLEQWFDEHALQPNIVAEIDDSSLIMELGQGGEGLFTGPSFLESEICGRYTVQVVGRLPDLRQQFYAISAERRVRHPSVLATCDAICERLVTLASREGCGAVGAHSRQSARHGRRSARPSARMIAPRG